MPKVLAAALLALTAVVVGDTARAEEAPTPRAVIEALADRLYVIGETTGREAEFGAAAAAARLDLQAAIARQGGGAALGRDEGGAAVLLIEAAFGGHAELVEELLSHKEVVAAIDTVGEGGLTAWQLANFAIQETIWACNATVFADPFKYVPRFVVLPYYRAGAEPAYVRTRRLLEAAGARADMAEARKLWLATCRFADPEARRKVEAGGDLLATVRAEGTRIVDGWAAKAAAGK